MGRRLTPVRVGLVLERFIVSQNDGSSYLFVFTRFRRGATAKLPELNRSHLAWNGWA
ncbi:hypothetical protein MPLSOD_40671 [Mesorhizobium sp. SOD10]|nr:hypothetical protein MPLSOD_40671 [Mesorhizobium sp. SOD10]